MKHIKTLISFVVIVVIANLILILLIKGCGRLINSYAGFRAETSIHFKTLSGFEVEMITILGDIRLRIFDSEKDEDGNQIWITGQDIAMNKEGADGELDVYNWVHVPKDHWFRDWTKSEVQRYYEIAQRKLDEKNAAMKSTDPNDPNTQTRWPRDANGRSLVTMPIP